MADSMSSGALPTPSDGSTRFPSASGSGRKHGAERRDDTQRHAGTDTPIVSDRGRQVAPAVRTVGIRLDAYRLAAAKGAMERHYGEADRVPPNGIAEYERSVVDLLREIENAKRPAEKGDPPPDRW